MSDLSDGEQAALSKLSSAFEDSESIIGTWRNSDLFEEVDSDGLHIRLGLARSPSVQILAHRYQAHRRRPLPSLLSAVLSSFNGMNIEETQDGNIEVTREPSVRDVWNGWLAAEEVEADETGDGKFSGLRFAMAYAQCRLLLVDEGKQSGAVVFDDAKGSPIVVASDLASFLHELAQTGLSIEALVGKRME